MKKILNWIKSENFDYILIFILIILINLTAGKTFFRIDLTSQKSYSLSEISCQTVRNLSEPLYINVFFSDDLPAPYNSVEQYLRDLLFEYKAKGGKNFSYRFFDMTREENKQLAQEYGINQIQVQKVETTEVTAKAAWMGLAITYGNNIRVLDSLESTSGLEYKITTVISKMISTAESINALSDNKQITLTLYPAEALQGLDINNYENLKLRVNNAFDAVNKKYNEKLNFVIHDASEEEAVAASNEFGLPLITFDNPDGTKSHTLLGLTAAYGKNHRIVPLNLANLPFFGWSVNGLENLEENISQAVESLITRSVETGYITGHGENSLQQQNYQMDINAVDSANLKNILSDLYSIKEIDLSENDIPLNIKTIIINGPKTAYSENELKKLDQFLMKGGNLMFFLEPLVEHDNGPNAPPSYTAPETGLDMLLTSWGITIEQNLVMDESCYQANSSNGKAGAYWIPLVTRKKINRTNPITRNIGAMFFFMNGSIDITGAEQNPENKVTVLASSSDRSWTMKDNIILYPGYIAPPADSSEMKSHNLAVLVEGKFNSAFSEETSESSDTKINTTTSISRSIQNGKILVVGSSNVTTSQLIDQNGNEPMALFIRNAVDYMNGSQGYCDMRSKGNFRNYLDIKSQEAAVFAKLFNLFGLALIVAFTGLIVWRIRCIRREEIRLEYNADDEREITSNKGERK